MSIISYKGFNEDMTCRDFQYEEGKSYTTEKVELCESGFHACEYPLDCFIYYNPNQSIYYQVEQSGELDKNNKIDSKIASTEIKIGVKLSIADIVKAAIDFTMKRIKPEAGSNETYGVSTVTGNYGVSTTTGNYGVSTTTGNYGVSTTTGYGGASSATGFHGVSTATGDLGVSSATGEGGSSSATGFHGASSATGNLGVSSATGEGGSSSVTGNRGVSSATGNCNSVYAGNPGAIAVSWGYKGKAKGVKGSRIVLSEWKKDKNNEEWLIINSKMVKIDGNIYKPETWYTMKEGKIVEWKED